MQLKMIICKCWLSIRKRTFDRISARRSVFDIFGSLVQLKLRVHSRGFDCHQLAPDVERGREDASLWSGQDENVDLVAGFEDARFEAELD